jgi:ESF2/ABP1 family protein
VPNKDQADRRRTFKQIPLAKKRKQEEQPEQVQRVLSKIF